VVKRIDILPPVSQRRRDDAYHVLPFATSGSDGPGNRLQLCSWSVAPGEHAKTVRVVGCALPTTSTKNLAWFVVAELQYRIGSLWRTERFRWQSSGWSRLITADEITVNWFRETIGTIIEGTFPEPPASNQWTLGASVCDGPLGVTLVSRTCDRLAAGSVFGTRIPVGASRCRLDVDGPIGGVMAGWGWDNATRGNDSCTVLEDFAYFVNLQTGLAERQSFDAQSFLDWRVVDDMAGMVAVETEDTPLPQRWRWLFELS